MQESVVIMSGAQIRGAVTLTNITKLSVIATCCAVLVQPRAHTSCLISSLQEAAPLHRAEAAQQRLQCDIPALSFRLL